MRRAEIVVRLIWLSGVALTSGCVTPPAVPAADTEPKPTKAGESAKSVTRKSEGLLATQGAKGPWWMQQTAMTKQGAINLKGKPWWPRAAKLKVGESFMIEATGEAKGRMLVRREMADTRGGKKVECIVWVIDDDGDGSVASGGDRDSDCYVVDYGCDGTVDRLLDYIDTDGDNDPDEMDIRHFVDGELRYTWFGMDLDDDSAMWSLSGYEYGGPSFFEADPYGDGMIYMNKLNTEAGTWSPISECPFAFYDTDGDGYSEAVVRCSAVPIRYDTNVDPDYANDYRRFRAPWSPVLRNMGIVNIRYSFDIDNLSGEKTPLHYEMGFNLVGAAPYKYPGMEHYNARRRPPQVTIVTPWKDLRRISDHYEAKETGFSWHENFDDMIAIGYGTHENNDYRWEGVFWIWERRFMENTGGPCQKWNVRREWSSKTASKRELYYSEVDKRIHLFGAEEGWVQVGHFSGLGVLGEIRMFDTDGNGYFDRWEYYSPMLGRVPRHVVTVRDEKATRIEWDYKKVSEFYTREVLPKALADNEKMMLIMNDVVPFDPPEGLKNAMVTGSANFRRYAQDVAREMHYQKLREHLTEQAHRVIRSYEKKAYHLGDLRNTKNIETTRNSHTAWLLLRALADLEAAYGQGDTDKACDVLATISRIKGAVQ